MTQLKLLFIIIFTFLLSLVAFGQEIDPNGNWYKEIKGVDDYYSHYDFKQYSISDVVNAKRQFELIRKNRGNNEWEGIYQAGTILGTAELEWNTEGGFIYHYVYHTLARLDFGKIRNKLDSVTLISLSTSKKKSYFSTKLVKVKFLNGHYLVPEKRLKDFAERAVGLSTDLEDWRYYLYKPNEPKVSGKRQLLPKLPNKYKHLLQLPIKTKIIEVGRRIIHKDTFDDGTVNYEEIHCFVTLGKGKSEKIRKGMNFFVKDLGEWIEVVKVLPKSSVGKIRRGFYNKKEACYNMELGQGLTIPCKMPKSGMKVETKLSENFF